MVQIQLSRQQDRTIAPARPAVRARVPVGQLLPLLSLILFLGGWELLVRLSDYPAFILPGPALVGRKLITVALNGTLWQHFSITLLEVLGGLALGTVMAVVLGYAIAKSAAIEQALSPYLVASQAIPVIAIAPLLVIWFGPGMLSKIIISALIVFFPILVNTIAGVRSVPADLRDLMRSLNATRWQTFTRLEVPAALPVLMAGLKVGATLSVIGAVVGEFAGASAGLGVMINVADGQYDTARMFVGVLALVVMALALYGLAALLERRLLAWQRAGNRQTPP
ncbi:MAG: ABC transporter permease [Anaerolineae bacterium]